MTATKSNDKKIDRAFEVVERLEKKEKDQGPSSGAEPRKSKKQGPAKRSGLQFRFSMDALISEQDTRATQSGDLRPGESNLLNFKITLPYVWKIPVIGKTALKIVRYLQADDRSESIRDILSSLKRKRP